MQAGEVGLHKFAITLSLKIPPHLQCVATLPCEMRFIDRAIGQWRRRLECVFQQQGGHIEHFDVKTADVTVGLL